MLVLTRKVGEIVRIAEEISIQVLPIQCGRVRLGVSAPREMTVRRTRPKGHDQPLSIQPISPLRYQDSDSTAPKY